MDAFSMSYTSASHRDLSRIYQDLKSVRSQDMFATAKSHLSIANKMPDISGKYAARNPVSAPHIGVVGAGLAGLRCADVLLKNGFRVTIIEGRNRLGGRVFQKKLPNGHLVDGGPNWIHGTENNPIMDLARETNTMTGAWDTASYAFDEDGQLLSTDEGERYSTLMWEIIGDAFKFSNSHSAEIDTSESLLDFFKTEVKKRIPDSTADFEKQRYILLQMAELWGAFIGSPISRQSLKFFWLEECIEGENLFCAGTYQKILELVARPALAEATITYETIVSRITTKDEVGGTVKLSTSGGAALEFDEVVFTAPLGWLKKNLDAFEPPLPTRLCNAVANISYGCLEKVYISFPSAFWLPTDSKARSVHGFCQWLSPTYAKETNAARWTQEVVELASLPGDTAHPTLLFYTYGEESEYITSTLDSLSGSKKKQEDFIFKFFMPYFSRLPHYDASCEDCRPTSFLASSWLRDDLAGNGSYANFQVGLENGDEDIRAMREGLPQRGLWLAGEHTAPFVALGTATGAYWSGENVAQRIAEAYGR